MSSGAQTKPNHSHNENYMLWPIFFKTSPALHSFFSALPLPARIDPASSPLGACHGPQVSDPTPTSVASLPIRSASSLRVACEAS